MKKIKLLLSTVIILFAFSCNDGETDKEKLKEELKEELREEMKAETDKDAEEQKDASQGSKAVDELVMKNYNYSMAEQVDYTGEIVHGKAWDDANGENFILFTEKNIEHKGEEPSHSKYLYAYHYADKGDGYKLLRKIQDHEEKCDLAMHAEFRLKTLEITDLDNDAKAEITFVYRLGCNGDPTPVPMKLMMLEDGEKYAIRGTTLVEMDPNTSFGGEMNVDASFKNAPNGFLEHAKRIWNSDKSYFDR